MNFFENISAYIFLTASFDCIISYYIIFLIVNCSFFHLQNVFKYDNMYSQ
nr:MAG TPA: hypothetical protein [Inoviridae sp.]